MTLKRFIGLVAAFCLVSFVSTAALTSVPSPDPPLLSGVSAAGGLIQFSVTNCFSSDNLQVLNTTNLASASWQVVASSPATSNPVRFSFPLASNSPEFYTVTANRAAGLPLATRGHDIFNAFGSQIYFRGIGRANGNDSPVGDWYGPGGNYWDGAQWDYNFDHLATHMDAVFQAMRVGYKCNFVREFLPVNWWWQDQIDTSKYQWFPKTNVSYRDYKELLVQRAMLQGIYVDFCPYSFRSYQDGDGGGTAPVVAAMDTNGIAVMNAIDSTDPTYLKAWQTWWTSAVQRLGNYPNVIWEIWNEPDGNSTVKTQYFNHCVEMYKTIRGLGNTNLILMQWRMTAVPNWQEELTWIPALYNQLTTAIGGPPTNVVFTFHAYRYSWNLQWATNYPGVLAQLQSPNWIPQTRSAGVDVPVLCNESGAGADLTGGALATEISWWDGIMRSCAAQDVGFCAYYWTPPIGWHPDSSLFTSWPASAIAPTPSQAGQMWINIAP